MFDESQPPSPNQALVALAPLDPEWHPILHASNQVVLYNPTSHALSVAKSSNTSLPQRLGAVTSPCPYCHRPLPREFEPGLDEEYDGRRRRSGGSDASAYVDDAESHSRAANYFQLLAIANETSSRPSSPPPLTGYDSGSGSGSGTARQGAFPREAMAEGYFKAFFQEEYKLGMGANGSVFLCQHVLDANPLGHFAVKKIAVGESHSYLLAILREVRLLETLRHRNIVTYHHAWLESCQFSAFGPKVPTLHVLMQWAEGGSLDDFIDVRLGRESRLPHIKSSLSNPHPHPSSPSATEQTPDIHSPSARIRAFRAMKRAPPEERERLRREMAERTGESVPSRPSWKAVHLLSAEEVRSLFADVTEGLGFLHDKAILHLDLKPGNVLLTWDEGELIPRAMLSDFGTSRDMLQSNRARSGNTGTLEYASPESLPSPQTGLLRQVDSKADMWSLGMILYKMLFFRLPYRWASEGEAMDAAGEVYQWAADGSAGGDAKRGGAERVSEVEKMDRLEREILGYGGFRSTPPLTASFEGRRLPRAFLVLLESLLNVTPSGRPSCERVLSALREGRFDPVKTASTRSTVGSLISLPPRKTSAPTPLALGPANGQPDVASRGAGRATLRSDEDGNKDMMSQMTGENGGRAALDEADRDEVDEKSALLYSHESLSPNRRQNSNSDRGVFGRIGEHLPWQIPTTRATCIQAVKSCVLVVKTVSLTTLCRDMNPVVIGLVSLVAVADTFSEDLRVSAVLGVVHVVAVWWFRRA
ncbi:kinase-like protein [Hygrophoropsis aurantiaca]|uniref:Kinase-like protein n=1 Tax=Hygrophoropsis aurantiaca TaxID=72124 RepID=A0ACB8A4P9_9AGAM|nr:kinase-like protein [Hygrophoropsis aurantiaca]